MRTVAELNKLRSYKESIKQQVHYYLRALKILLEDYTKLTDVEFAAMNEIKDCIEHGEIIESRQLQGIYDSNPNHDIFSKRYDN